MALGSITTRRFEFARRLADSVAELRRKRLKASLNRWLIPPLRNELTVSPDLAVLPRRDTYAPSFFYEGSHRFSRHIFAEIGELQSRGEEFECAVYLDTHPQVMFWLRNIPKREDSFWLQTSTDKFYPDFVAWLKDDRILVVEYKGANDWSNDDSKEKRMIGEVWAERSDSRFLFSMPKGPDWAAVDRVIKGAG